MPEKIKIDYENPDVEDIMSQVRDRIEAHTGDPGPEDVKAEAQAEPRSPAPQLPEPSWARTDR